MINNIFSKINYALFEDTPDAKEIYFLSDKLEEAVNKYADPKWNSIDVQNHFSDIAGGLVSEACEQAFKRGMITAMQLFSHATMDIQKSSEELEREWQKYSTCVSLK